LNNKKKMNEEEKNDPFVLTILCENENNDQQANQKTCLPTQFL